MWASDKLWTDRNRSNPTLMLVEPSLPQITTDYTQHPHISQHSNNSISYITSWAHTNFWTFCVQESGTSALVPSLRSTWKLLISRGRQHDRCFACGALPAPLVRKTHVERVRELKNSLLFHTPLINGIMHDNAVQKQSIGPWRRSKLGNWIVGISTFSVPDLST